MKQFHIHYVSLMMSQKLVELFLAVMEQIIKTAALNVSIPIFNYLLLYQDQLPDHDENTPEAENGDEMNVSSIACCLKSKSYIPCISAPWIIPAAVKITVTAFSQA